MIEVNNCIFCKIVKGEAPAYKIWEDDKHIAFLSIFPNTKAFSVVVTKEHYPSFYTEMPERIFENLFTAAKGVAQLLDSKLEDVGRTGLIMEGFGVNHAHVKLFPMHGTKGEWRERIGKPDKYFDYYEGYISSHDCNRADDNKLKKLADKIKN